MVSRRDWLRITAAAALGLNPRVLEALQSQEVITRAIPSTGERLPVVGLGGANTYSRVARAEDFSTIGGVLRALVDGVAVCSIPRRATAPPRTYQGGVAEELRIADRIWWATKVNVAGRGGTPADPAAALAQIERSFERLRIPVIDLIQVHNMGDPPTQLGVLERLKVAGRVRYSGITTTSSRQYAALANVMRNEPIDFIGIDYAVDNRTPEEVILPLAQERRIGVIVYLPFGRIRMWQRIGDRPLPDWAAEFDAHTWAQFMLKFVIAHPAITVATPGTSDPEHMADNLAGGRGRLPNAEQRERMIELVESLPRA